MSVLLHTLNHPTNRGHSLSAAARWMAHNVRRRLVPERERSVTVGDVEIVGPSDHPVINSATYARDGLYDYDLFHCVRALAREGDVFVDVGANIGSYAIVASRYLGPTGAVVAFEPVADQRHFLERNLAGGSAMYHILPVAVADRERSITFEGVGVTTRHLVADAGETRTTTVDDALRRLGLQARPGLMKLDIEGWEPAALVGARSWISSHARALIVEAAGHAHRCPVAWTEAVAMLQEGGFVFVYPDFVRGEIVRFPDPGPVSPRHDYVAVREEALPVLQAAVQEAAASSRKTTARGRER